MSSRTCLAPCTCLSQHPYLTADTTTEQPSPDHNSSSEQPSSAFSWSLFFESTAFLSLLLTPLLPLNSFIHPSADISYSITAYFSLLLIKTLSLNSLPQLSADITYSTTANLSFLLITLHNSTEQPSSVFCWLISVFVFETHSFYTKTVDFVLAKRSFAFR